MKMSLFVTSLLFAATLSSNLFAALVKPDCETQVGHLTTKTYNSPKLSEAFLRRLNGVPKRVRIARFMEAVLPKILREICIDTHCVGRIGDLQLSYNSAVDRLQISSVNGKEKSYTFDLFKENPELEILSSEFKVEDHHTATATIKIKTRPIWAGVTRWLLIGNPTYQMLTVTFKSEGDYFIPYAMTIGNSNISIGDAATHNFSVYLPRAVIGVEDSNDPMGRPFYHTSY